MNRFPNILVLGTIIVCGILVVSLIWQNYLHWRRQHDLPLSGDEAFVASKRVNEEFHTDTDREKPHSDHFITFQLVTSGEAIEFRTTAADFASINEGERGILWHQGTIFRRFEKQQ
ncbi:MAG: DUF2500 family protein [Deltaproteobacteria bacterium]|nr:DUF2500 family protein [Deltaproteobacteria bacterium]